MPDEQPIDDDSNNAHNDKMRRYPSSHIRKEVLQTNSNPKYQVLAKYSFWRGGVTPDQRKSHAPSPDQIFILGEVVLWTPHPSNTWVEALKEFCTRNIANDFMVQQPLSLLFKSKLASVRAGEVSAVTWWTNLPRHLSPHTILQSQSIWISVVVLIVGSSPDT